MPEPAHTCFLNLQIFDFFCQTSILGMEIRNSHRHIKRYSQKQFSIWRPSVILNLQNFDFFVKYPSSEWKVASAYQIWSRPGNSPWIKMFLKWGHPPFWICENCRLHLHMILHLLSKFRVNQPIWRREKRQKRFSIWRPSATLNLLWRHHIASETAFNVPNFVLNFHDVRLRIFWNYS